MIGVGVLFLSLSAAQSSMPVAEVPYHRLVWNPARSRYQHFHQDCTVDGTIDGPLKVRPYDFGWYGSARDSQLLKYTLCPGAPVQSLERALQAFRHAGVPFTEQTLTCPVAELRQDAQGNDELAMVPWMGTFAANGEFLFTSTHGVYVVADESDPLYKGIFLRYPDIPAVAYLLGLEMVGNGPAATGPSMGWHVVVNAVDHVYLQSHPSLLAHADWIDGSMYHTDVLMHELLHVLGAGHLTSDLRDYFPSAIYASTSTRTRHLALETNALLYDRDGEPNAGTYLVTPWDQRFLNERYGFLGSFSNTLRMHPWEPEQDAEGKYFFDDCGWEPTADYGAHEPYPYGLAPLESVQSCMGNRKLVNWEVLAVESVLPRFTSRTARVLRLRFYAETDVTDEGNVQTVEKCPPSGDCWAEFGVDGYVEVSVPAGGSWSAVTDVTDLWKVNIQTNVQPPYLPNGTYIDTFSAPALLYMNVFEVDGSGNEVAVAGMQGVPLNVRNWVQPCVEG